MYHERASRLPGAFVWTGTSKGETRVLPDGCMDLTWRNGNITIAEPVEHTAVATRDVKELAGVSLGQLVAPMGNGAYRSTEWPSGS